MVAGPLRSELLPPTLGTPLAFPAGQSIIEQGLLGSGCVRMYHYGWLVIPRIDSSSLIVLGGHHDWGRLLLLQLIQDYIAGRRKTELFLPRLPPLLRRGRLPLGGVLAVSSSERAPPGLSCLRATRRL